MERAWQWQAMGPRCLGGTDKSLPACYCCEHPWQWWGGKRLRVGGVGCSYTWGWVFSPTGQPPYPLDVLAECSCRRIGRAPHDHFLFLLCSLGSCQAPSSDPQELDSSHPEPLWVPASPIPLSHLWLPTLMRCPVVGSAVLGQGIGLWGAGPVKFSKPQVRIGIWLLGCGGVGLGGMKLSKTRISAPQPNSPAHPAEQLWCDGLLDNFHITLLLYWISYTNA